MARQISASVGRGGRNRKDDSATVQELLNKVPAHLGGPDVPLAVDGLPWQKTIAAINKFQKVACGFKWPDGRVDPDRRTLARLNEFDTVDPVDPVGPEIGVGPCYLI